MRWKTEIKTRRKQERIGCTVWRDYELICSHSALAHSVSISSSLFAPLVPPVSVTVALLPNRNSGMTMCQLNRLFSIVSAYSPSHFFFLSHGAFFTSRKSHYTPPTENVRSWHSVNNDDILYIYTLWNLEMFGSFANKNKWFSKKVFS